MGSVLSEEKCKCGGVVTIDDYYKTFEIYVSCNRCGYFYSRELKRDENYKPIFDDQGKPIYIEKELPGYGSACIWSKKGVGSIYYLREPLTKEIEEEFFKILQEEDVDKEKSYLISYDKQTNLVKAIYGRPPLLYQQLEEKYEEEKSRSIEKNEGIELNSNVY